MTLENIDYGQLAGAAEDINNLLTIFAHWFDESHKAANIDRTYSKNDIYFLWDAAPRYNSLLNAALCDVIDLQKQLEALTDEQIAAYQAQSK